MTSQTANESYAALLGRLQKLERENRKIKRFGALVLVAMAALILTGQTSKNRALDADSLTIRDVNGNVRMELGTLENHSPILRMVGTSDNKPSLLLTSDQGGSGLTFFFGKGIIMLSNTDTPSLLLAGGGATTSIDAGAVHISDNDNFHAFVGKMATVDDRTGNTTWSSAASLKLVRKDGKVIWQAP